MYMADANLLVAHGFGFAANDTWTKTTLGITIDITDNRPESGKYLYCIRPPIADTITGDAPTLAEALQAITSTLENYFDNQPDALDDAQDG